MSTYTPVSGVKKGASLTFSRRGSLNESKTHAVAADTVRGGELVTTVCSRSIIACTVYGAESWPTLHAQPHATHETYVCRQCVKLAQP